MEDVNILVVDDDLADYYLLVKKLSKSLVKLNIKQKTNGREALDYLLNTDKKSDFSMPQIIFLDINMPIMDGWSFISELEKEATKNKDLNNIKIILHTSSSRESDKVRSSQIESVSSYIVKGEFDHTDLDQLLSDSV